MKKATEKRFNVEMSTACIKWVKLQALEHDLNTGDVLEVLVEQAMAASQSEELTSLLKTRSLAKGS